MAKLSKLETCLLANELAPLPSYGPRGLDRQEWEDAEFLQRRIGELQKKTALADEGLQDTPESAALIIRATARVQTILMKRAAVRSGGYYRIHNVPTVPELNEAFQRYRKCENHCLALVPSTAWRKSISAYDEHVLAVTLTLAIELPHPRARRNQDSLKLASEFYVCFQGVFFLKPSQLCREYKAFIAGGNKRPTNKTKLPLATFERRVVEPLVGWFPQLAEVGHTCSARHA